MATVNPGPGSTPSTPAKPSTPATPAIPGKPGTPSTAKPGDAGTRKSLVENGVEDGDMIEIPGEGTFAVQMN